jgi:EpsI family protein
MATLMVLTFAITTAKTVFMQPIFVVRSIDLAAMIPEHFGRWKWIPSSSAGVVNPQQDALSALIYTQTLTRIYRNEIDGQSMMLSIAYGTDQRDDLQVHYPEVCYPAQGFDVLSNTKASISTPQGKLMVRRMETRLNVNRNEPVTYWAMLGDKVVLDSMQKKITEMRMSWAGKRADGLLFRVSTVDERNDRAFAGETRFITDLLNELPVSDRHRLSGL